MIEVYDKKFSTDRLDKICWIVAIPCLLCSGIIFFTYSNEEIGESILLKTLGLLILAPAGILGITRIFQSGQAYGSIGETSFLRIKDNSISFLNTQIRISEIESVLIRIGTNRVEGHFSGNNYLEIKTRSDKHQLGLLIANDKGIESVEKLIKELKQRKTNVIYERYV